MTNISAAAAQALAVIDAPNTPVIAPSPTIEPGVIVAPRDIV